MNKDTQHPLQFEVRRLLSGPVTFDFDLTPDLFDIAEDPQFRFEQNIKGSIRATAAGGDTVLITADLETVVSSDCVRCLEAIVIPIKARSQQAWFLDPGPEERARDKDDDKLYFDGDLINPSESLREEIMIQLPAFPRCSPDDNADCAATGEKGRWTNESKTKAATATEAAEENGNSWAAQLGSIKDKLKTD